MNKPGVWNYMSRGRGEVQSRDGQGFIIWAPEMGSKFPLVGSLKTPFYHYVEKNSYPEAAVYTY